MFGKLLEHKITLAIASTACAVVLGASAYYLLRPDRKVFSTVPVQVMTLEESVTADGSVDSLKHVSLSFRKDGTVSAVNVSVGQGVAAGQVLASLDSGQLYASLQGARADVTSAAANLTTVQKGATVQTRTVYEQNVSNAKTSLGTAARDAYLKVEDAFLNKIGILFNNNTSANPTLNIPGESFAITNSINNARSDMTDRLASWKAALDPDPTSGGSVQAATDNLAAAKNFMDSLSDQVNRLTPNNSGLSATTLAADVAAMSAAASEINTAQTDWNTALAAYQSASDQLNVITASSTPEANQVAGAALQKAQANVSSIQSQLGDSTLVAPWNGIVASVNPKVGEHFGANDPAIEIISTGLYKIDVMIPENEVGAIEVGSKADIVFDSGGNITATGTVSSIDLAPTVTNGVGAYKTTVYLGSGDPRIRTGMTATITIHGTPVPDALSVPESAIIKKSDGAYAIIPDSSGSYHEVKVTTGARGNGYVEILSGLSAGENVATFGQ